MCTTHVWPREAPSEAVARAARERSEQERDDSGTALSAAAILACVGIM